MRDDTSPIVARGAFSSFLLKRITGKESNNGQSHNNLFIFLPMKNWKRFFPVSTELGAWSMLRQRKECRHTKNERNKRVNSFKLRHNKCRQMMKFFLNEIMQFSTLFFIYHFISSVLCPWPMPHYPALSPWMVLKHKTFRTEQNRKRQNKKKKKKNIIIRFSSGAYFALLFTALPNVWGMLWKGYVCVCVCESDEIKKDENSRAKRKQ